MPNTLQIKFAFAPECKAVINGTETPIKILGNRGGNLLFRCLDDNSLYEVKTPFAGADNTMEFDVVWTDYVEPTPEPEPESDPTEQGG